MVPLAFGNRSGEGLAVKVSPNADRDAIKTTPGCPTLVFNSHEFQQALDVTSRRAPLISTPF
jgi:hypothetical protein